MRFQIVGLLAAMAMSLPALAQPGGPTLPQRLSARLTFRKMVRKSPAVRAMYRAEQWNRRVPEQRSDARIAGTATALLGTALAVSASPVSTIALGIGMAIATTATGGALMDLSALKRQARIATVTKLAAGKRLTPQQEKTFRQADWIPAR